MSWVAVSVAVGGGTALIGGIQANQTRQNKKGLIGQSYAHGQERLALQQKDVRGGTAESLGERGLIGGGTVRPDLSEGHGDPWANGAAGTPGQTMPSVTGAHDLGGQQMEDLGREQFLERRNLAQARDNAYGEVNDAATQGMIGSAINGIKTGMSVYGARSEMGGGDALKGATPMGYAPDSPPSGMTGAFGVGVNNPLGVGAWKNPATSGSSGAAASAQTNAGFNVNG